MAKVDQTEELRAFLGQLATYAMPVASRDDVKDGQGATFFDPRFPLKHAVSTDPEILKYVDTGVEVRSKGGQGGGCTDNYDASTHHIDLCCWQETSNVPVLRRPARGLRRSSAGPRTQARSLTALLALRRPDAPRSELAGEATRW